MDLVRTTSTDRVSSRDHLSSIDYSLEGEDASSLEELSAGLAVYWCEYSGTT